MPYDMRNVADKLKSTIQSKQYTKYNITEAEIELGSIRLPSYKFCSTKSETKTNKNFKKLTQNQILLLKKTQKQRISRIKTNQNC